MPEIERFCQKWTLTELALFGSVLRDNFRLADSDVDVMVQFHIEPMIPPEDQLSVFEE